MPLPGYDRRNRRNLMEFAEVVRRRRMCRAYTDEDVPDDVVRSILGLGLRFPSAGHTQPQELIVVRDPTVKRDLGRAAFGQTWLADAPVVIAVVSDTRRSARRYGDRGVHFYSIVDGAFASLLLLLAAVDRGLGAAFVGAFEDEEVSAVLGLPRNVRPIGLVPIGHCADRAHGLARRAPDEIIRRDRYAS
jgi:nitroreductase